MSLLSIQTEMYNSVLLVRLRGELDHHTAANLRQSIDTILHDRKEVIHLILNLQELTFMDSSGIGVILGRYKEIDKKKGQLVICALNPMIYRIIEMAGMFKIISIATTEQEALSELGVA